MEISPEIHAAHCSFSPVARKFLDFVAEHPEGLKRLHFTRPEAELEGQYYSYPLQSWPVYLDKKKLQEISEATLAIPKLIKSIPERIFKWDANKISRFYGVRNELVTGLLMAPPNGIDSAMTRGDFIDGPGGFKCVEVNMGSLVGGWQIHFWEHLYRQHHLWRRFHQENGLNPMWRDPFRALIAHIIKDSLANGLGKDGVLNVVMVVRQEELALTANFFAGLYADMLAEMDMGLSGVGLCASYPGNFKEKRAVLYLDDMPVHALVEYTTKPGPDFIFRVFKAGNLTLYNGPLQDELSDKRNLVLLSEHEGSDLFTEWERSIIRRFIPWSRRLLEREADFHGETIFLPEYLAAHRERFVIKSGGGYGGDDVHVGPCLSQEEWEVQLKKAFSHGDWLVQEYFASHPYLFQVGDEGYDVHDMVWGLFGLGDEYGGGFLRMMPKNSGDGVINSARGATEGLMWEI